MNFCRRCGTTLAVKRAHIYTCQNGHILYANSSPAVGIFLIDAHNNTVLLSRRAIEPYKGSLDAFGGFLDGGETVEEAAKRELREELSLEPHEYGPLHYIRSSTIPYPYGGEAVDVVSILFWAKLTTSRQLTPADDVAAIVALPIDELDEHLFHANDTTMAVLELKKIKP